MIDYKNFPPPFLLRNIFLSIYGAKHWPSIDRLGDRFYDVIWYFDENLCSVICFKWQMSAVTSRWKFIHYIWLNFHKPNFNFSQNHAILRFVSKWIFYFQPIKCMTHWVVRSLLLQCAHKRTLHHHFHRFFNFQNQCNWGIKLKLRPTLWLKCFYDYYISSSPIISL